MLAGILVLLGLFAAEPIRVMPLGDSITEPSETTGRYVFPLWRMVQSSGLPVVFVGSRAATYHGVTLRHEGHNGFSADQILAKVGGWARDAAPDIVLLHVGHNDHRHGQSVESTLDEIEGIVLALREVNPRIAVVVAQIIETADGKTNPLGSPHAAFIEKLNHGIAGMVGRLNTRPSPVTTIRFDAFDGNRHTRGGVHPNAVGEEIMAAAWYSALEKIQGLRSRSGKHRGAIPAAER